MTNDVKSPEKAGNSLSTELEYRLVPSPWVVEV